MVQLVRPIMLQLKNGNPRKLPAARGLWLVKAAVKVAVQLQTGCPVSGASGASPGEGNKSQPPEPNRLPWESLPPKTS